MLSKIRTLPLLLPPSEMASSFSSSSLASPATRARNERVHVLFTDNPESRPVLCYLIAFLALADVSSVEISSRLFGGSGAGGKPSVVAKMVLDAIKETKVEGLVRRPGGQSINLFGPQLSFFGKRFMFMHL